MPLQTIYIVEFFSQQILPGRLVTFSSLELRKKAKYQKDWKTSEPVILVLNW